jgi:glycosyltransferase involved in cell wall biosynthesis/ribosomal protein S18 acetylase RimI-like enzyme
LRTLRIAHVTTVDMSLRYLLLAQLRALRDAGFDVTAVSAPGPWSPGLASEGIRHLPWRSVTRAWDPTADARAFAELLGLFRRERFDLVHTHNPKPGLLGRVAARVAGVPCVVNTVHGLYATPDDPPRRRLPVLALERLGARASDLELYQSAEDLAWARRIGVVTPSRSLLLGNGIDLERFDPERATPERRAALRRELGLPERAVVVATVGRLVAEKGYRELFAAAAEVRRSRPDVRFVVVGDIDRDKADAIGDDEIERARADIVFTGWRDDVSDLLAASDVFVLPSWREGMPRSAIEAAAMGMPLVLTDVRGCREVARDGVDGKLVPARDPARLAAAIAELAGDGALRERLGAAARERALDRFDERRVVAAVLDEYRGLFERKGLVAGEGGAARRGGGMGPRIRRARRDDAPALARLHREALPAAFLPTLGERFLARLYRALADDRGAVVAVAERDGQVVGFASGYVSGRAFSRRFYLRHGLLALAGAALELRRPGAARRALETARHTRGGGGLPEPELASIAVAAGHRGHGIARALAAEVVAGLAELGAGEVKVVVGAGNAPGNGLYAGLGFERGGEIALHDGVASNVWVARCRS